MPGKPGGPGGPSGPGRLYVPAHIDKYDINLNIEVVTAKVVSTLLIVNAYRLHTGGGDTVLHNGACVFIRMWRNSQNLLVQCLNSVDIVD